MVDVKISYEMALKLVLYMEEEITRLKRDYTDLTHKYNETLLYNEDIQTRGRSLNTNYNIDSAYYEETVKNLRIRQYERALELSELLKSFNTQNNGNHYIKCSLKRDVYILFKAGYDDLETELARLKIL